MWSDGRSDYTDYTHVVRGWLKEIRNFQFILSHKNHETESEEMTRLQFIAFAI